MTPTPGVAPGWEELPARDIPWPRLHVVVAGIGVAGAACALRLRQLQAKVTVVDKADRTSVEQAASRLEDLGARVLTGADAVAVLPDSADLVLTSPGFPPSHPLLAEARVPVWGDVELAWRLRPPGQRWLAVTGTNGKTTTTSMLGQILTGAGLRAAECGNIGRPVVDAVGEGYDVLAVELSSFQLHWAPSVRPFAGAVLNIAPDHLDWHGSFEAYAASKTRVWAPGAVCVGNADDAETSRLLTGAPGRRVSFTLGAPGPGQLGVVEDLLVDRAFADGVPEHADPLVGVGELKVAGKHNVANALAAAALARAAGVTAADVGRALAAFEPGSHRMEFVASVREVSFVNDSKATNPHAALASLSAYPHVVWIAGGLNKGLTFDDLVRDARPHLRAVVHIGRCGPEIRDALQRLAPEIPEIGASTMDHAVSEAFRLAQPGDTVLLAPAAASMDMFVDYAHRGRAFVDAVARLAAHEDGP